MQPTWLKFCNIRAGCTYPPNLYTMERKAKLQKLNVFRRHLPHISAAALSACLIAVSLEGVPDLTDRNSLRIARNMAVNDATPYGPILNTLTGTGKENQPVLSYS